jgi:hypothetical protein
MLGSIFVYLIIGTPIFLVILAGIFGYVAILRMIKLMRPITCDSNPFGLRQMVLSSRNLRGWVRHFVSTAIRQAFCDGVWEVESNAASDEFYFALRAWSNPWMLPGKSYRPRSSPASRASRCDGQWIEERAMGPTRLRGLRRLVGRRSQQMHHRRAFSVVHSQYNKTRIAAKPAHSSTWPRICARSTPRTQSVPRPLT